MSSLRKKDGTVICPSVTAKSGQQTTVEKIQKYRARKVVDLGGGQTLITASLIDKAGTPIKK